MHVAGVADCYNIAVADCYNDAVAELSNILEQDV